MLKDLIVKKKYGELGEILMLSGEVNEFKRIQKGVYYHKLYKFYFQYFIEECTDNVIVNGYLADSTKFGLCDTYKQILNKYPTIEKDQFKNYVISLTPIKTFDEILSELGTYIGDKGCDNTKEVYFFRIIEIC